MKGVLRHHDQAVDCFGYADFHLPVRRLLVKHDVADRIVDLLGDGVDKAEVLQETLIRKTVSRLIVIDVTAKRTHHNDDAENDGIESLADR